MKKEYIGIVKTRNNFRDVLDEVLVNQKVFILTSKGKEKAAIVPLSFLEKYHSENETNKDNTGAK